MINREKVKKGLDLCLSGNISACEDCPYSAECAKAIGVGASPLRRDVLELLKEQEPVESCHKCSGCGNEYTIVDDSQFVFCPYCGRKVKWNDKN